MLLDVESLIPSSGAMMKFDAQYKFFHAEQKTILC
jgi:hypothetical protein